MLRALLPFGTSRLKCFTSTLPSASTLTVLGLGHQAELRKTFSNHGYLRRGTSKLGPNFLHQSSPSLSHWRGKRSFVRRREAERIMGKVGKSFTKPWQPEEDQAIFDFVEKFGSGDGRPGPVPKMWKEEVGPPEWAREHLEEASRKEMEKNILDAFYQISVEMKGEKEVERMKEEAQKNKERVDAEEKMEKEESPKKDGASGRNPDSELF